MNRVKCLLILSLAIIGCGTEKKAQAQDFPGLGVGNMWANELQFQNQFYNWARQRSWQLAREIPNDQPLPFNAQTLSEANRATSRAYEGFNRNWHHNSQRTMNAIERWDNGVIRGVAPYSNPYGHTKLLPYGPNSYYRGPHGYYHRGYNPYYSGNHYRPSGY